MFSLHCTESAPPDKKEYLIKQFDKIFATVTGYNDLDDRVSGEFKLPSLADLIKQKAQLLLA